MKEKWQRYLDYMTKTDPVIYHRFDHIVGMSLADARILLPEITITNYKQTHTCEAKYDEIFVTLDDTKSNIVEINDICKGSFIQ